MILVKLQWCCVCFMGGCKLFDLSFFWYCRGWARKGEKVEVSYLYSLLTLVRQNL